MTGTELAALIVSILSSTVRIGTPIALSSIGEVLSERAGIVNLGLEGQILMGAFIATVVSHFTGNPYLGVLGALLTGAVMGLIHVVFSLKFHASQIVIGVANNIFALGFTTVGLVAIWNNRGKSDAVTGLPIIRIPFLDSIPILGPILNNHTLIVYLMIAITILTWLVLFRTNAGLRLRSIGENPKAAETVGINIVRIQILAVSIGGALSGLAGSYLSLSDLNLFSRNMSAGRGFIALAATILGNWNPFGALGASMIFGFLDAMQIRLQGTGFPTQFIQMIPYVLVIILLAGVVRKVRAPSAAGKVYEKGT
jgi:general nucleoside transport system permease protein